jgi:hypothetical protein
MTVRAIRPRFLQIGRPCFLGESLNVRSQLIVERVHVDVQDATGPAIPLQPAGDTVAFRPMLHDVKRTTIFKKPGGGAFENCAR